MWTAFQSSILRAAVAATTTTTNDNDNDNDNDKNNNDMVPHSWGSILKMFGLADNITDLRSTRIPMGKTNL